MKFSENAKNLRLNADLTQQQLSNHLGITASAIGYLENGQREPTGRTLVAYAKYFDVTIDSLVGLEPNIEDLFNLPTQKKSADTLSTDEMQLIQDYRALTPALQEMLQATIQTWKGMSDSKTRPNRA